MKTGRTAVISDIHGNPHALESVIADLDAIGVDEVLVAGDMVGRGPAGDAVVARIRALGWPCLRGNHEDYLLSFIHREVPEDWYGRDEWAGSEWMADELNPDSIAFIDALPSHLDSDLFEELRVVHASPASNRDGLGVWTDEATLTGHLESIDAPVLVCAHTHRPMVRRIGPRLVVNVGSVGLPFNGDQRAQYAVFSPSVGALPSVEIRRVKYDIEGFLKLYETSGFLEHGNVTAQLLEREVRVGRPHLVPFLAWCKHRGVTAHLSELDAFYALFDPHRPLAEFFEALGVRRADRSGVGRAKQLAGTDSVDYVGPGRVLPESTDRGSP